ncbi:MAG TPA: Crp/Fnr family transcriptional regulator [Allosphingosinicella sp.]|nr:Crp/Fnr family transcriptional regulator [Allosphingosinicella sp.]
MERNLFTKNVLLGAVEPSLRGRTAARLKSVPLSRGAILYSQGSEVDQVYFPLNGLVGILAETMDGERMDSALVGREGAIGLFEACGTRQYFAEAQVQVAGEAASMSASDYRELFSESEGIRTAVHRYVEQLMSETRQSVVCSGLHDVEARLSRTIVEALEKSATGDVLPLTQETLARMLGAQRTTVAEIMSRMQRDAILVTRRAAISVQDPVALERMACTCLETARYTRRAIWSSDLPACESTMVAA